MFKLSSLIARIEKKIDRKLYKFRGRWKYYLCIGVMGLYFWGMLINSVRLGIDSVFGSGPEPATIWVVNPVRNLTAVFTPTGFMMSAVSILLICLITKKGHYWLSGHKYKKDSRGFNIMPDGTHGSSGFLTYKEMERFLTLAPVEKIDGTILGKYKEHVDDDDKYSIYVSMPEMQYVNQHMLVVGGSGSGKSYGVIKPFVLQCAKRMESVLLVDPKGEFYEDLSEYLRSLGYVVKAYNLLDPELSDAWNCCNDLVYDINLVDRIADTIMKNTTNENDRAGFFELSEQNLLMAMLHYICSQIVPGSDELLPITERSLPAIYNLISEKSVFEIERMFDDVPKSHPLHKPFGVFKKADRRQWGNIATGVGIRLQVFQNETLAKMSSYNEIDLTLPGQRPCAYFVIISDQENPHEFMTSMFFSMLFSRLNDYARRHGDRGKLPVRVNVALDEFTNIGRFGFTRLIPTVRSRNINCICVIQSVAGLAEAYPGKEWEAIMSNLDIQLFLGGNDEMTGKHFSSRSGKISVMTETNQMPLMPLFSPVYHSTRPYSQSKTTTQRDLLQVDEVLRLPYDQLLVIIKGQKPMLLKKVTPDDFPDAVYMEPVKVSDYMPEWRSHEEARSQTAVSKEKPLCSNTLQPSFNEPADEERYSQNTDEAHSPGFEKPHIDDSLGAFVPMEVTIEDILHSR